MLTFTPAVTVWPLGSSASLCLASSEIYWQKAEQNKTSLNSGFIFEFHSTQSFDSSIPYYIGNLTSLQKYISETFSFFPSCAVTELFLWCDTDCVNIEVAFINPDAHLMKYKLWLYFAQCWRCWHVEIKVHKPDRKIILISAEKKQAINI